METAAAGQRGKKRPLNAGDGADVKCPYLDTVNRAVLDFDFEKCCSVSLSTLNVYACLVCGKFFQGRGRGTQAYTHSLEVDHHVFMNLRTGRVYCLPDSYEVVDSSLDDIRHVLNPKFASPQVEDLDRKVQWSRALDGTEFLPGTIGLNNIRATDYINVVIQALNRIAPIRNYFLEVSNYERNPSELVQSLGELVRKIWNARNFKGQVSPHAFMQAIIKRSKKRFMLDKQSDPVEFLSWLLNMLHKDLGGKSRSSIISDCLQGELIVTNVDDNSGEEGAAEARTPFFMLGLDLPPAPLFKDALERNSIPQIPISGIIKKYDGVTVLEQVKIGRRKLPKYLILHMKRFTKNNFFVEKNPTIVTFPIKSFNLVEYLQLPEGSKGVYDLVANICHDGKPGGGTYRVHTLNTADSTWYELQDLHVIDVLPQMVALSETYIQIYKQV